MNCYASSIYDLPSLFTRRKRGALNLRSSIPRTQSLPKRLLTPGRASALPFLLGRRGCRHLDIDVDLSRAAAKQSCPKNKSQRQKQNHKDHQDRDNTRTATTISIVSHKRFLLFVLGNS